MKISSISGCSTKSATRLSIVLRYSFLALITAYGLIVALMSQASTVDYRGLAALQINCLTFYLIVVGLYLWIARMREWKYLLVLSVIVCASVLELLLRAGK